MSSALKARAARMSAAAFACTVAVVALTGCSLTSDNVSCSTSSCTATLSGDGAEARILGTTVTLASTQDGRATLGVGDASVSCAAGESISAGPLSVTCTSVTDGAVEITASVN